MPLISAKPIRAPRGRHQCGICRRGPLAGHILLYGTPKEGGKPLSMRVHVACIPIQRLECEPKIAAAVQALRDATTEGSDAG